MEFCVLIKQKIKHGDTIQDVGKVSLGELLDSFLAEDLQKMFWMHQP